MRYWKAKSITPGSKVCISVVTYNQTNCLSSLIHALRAQTFKDFKAYILHDGPWSNEASTHYLNAVGSDHRFVKLNSPTREAKFGHHLRQVGFDMGTADKCNWLCTMNADCWYAPVYLEWMLGSAYENKSNFIYCNMVHSHKLWKPMKSDLKRGAIDAGNWIAHTSLVGDTKWNSNSFSADWEYVNKLKNKPDFKPSKVDGYIFTHN
jgi:GT2 family glycosyltransferase